MRRWLVIVIVLLGFGLRVYHLDHFGFWQDEGLTPLRAGYPIGEILSNRVTIQEGVTQDTHPPLYFLGIHASRLMLGESDFAYRFPSVLAGVLLIPLLYQFGRRLFRPGAGLVAAGLVAVNPFNIWYSQEARMYTLAVLLSAASAYALWRALSGGRSGRWFGIYGLFAGLAFMTHYTAAILVVAQLPFWIWLLWQQGRRRLIIVGGIAAVLLLIPFIPFTVPRLFTGAETNYTYVSPLIMLQDVVHGFTMGWTGDFSRLSTRLLDLGVALVLAAGIVGPWPGRRGRLPRLFLLVYLLAIVVGLAAGSLIKPMYQGARHIMLGSPAFFLLLGLGVVSLARRWRLAGSAAVAVVFLAPAVSLQSLYYDDRYAKDDIRALVQYVEQMAGGEDIVLYNNAILLGLHRHYDRRSDLPVTALPVYPNPAGEETVQQLQSLSEQYKRIWFITDPPADGRDASGLVQTWLQDNLRQVDRHSEHARTILVQVKAYDTRPAGVAEIPDKASPVALSWPEMPSLGGWATSEQLASSPTLWLDLYWQGGGGVPTDIQLRFAVVGQDGVRWLDESQPFWSEGQPDDVDREWLHLSYPLKIPAGLPPGDYELMLLPFQGQSNAPLGDWQALGQISLASVQQAIAALDMDTRTSLLFKNELVLLGLENTDVAVRPGHALPLLVYWQAPSVSDRLVYELELVGPRGKVWFTWQARPGPEWLAADDWPAGRPLRELIGLNIPAEAPAGDYRLRWRLTDGQTDISVRPNWRPWYGQSATLGHITVEAWPLVTSLPQASQVVEAAFGPAIALYGYDLATEEVAPGQPLALNLYWLAREVPDTAYYVFVHLVSAADENIVSQIDRIPVDWTRPTLGWRAGEVLTDVYTLPVPADLPAGSYHLYIGLFNPETFARPTVIVDGQERPDGRLLLETLVIP